FHPQLPGRRRTDAVDIAEQIVADSVLGVGLLPERRWSAAGSNGVDVSGLGGSAGQAAPGGVPDLVAAGTDEARYVQAPGTLAARPNRPTLNGVEASPFDHLDAVLDGFGRMYWFLVQYRDQLLAHDGPLASFADDEVRVLARPTATYAGLLQARLHPDMLRN